MASIYLIGAPSSWDDPQEWQREIEKDYPLHSFLSGTPGESDGPLVDNVREILSSMDGIFVRFHGTDTHEEELFVQKAYEDGVPVVIWDESDDGVSAWARQHSRYVHEDRDQALRCLLMYSGVSAEEVISKG